MRLTMFQIVDVDEECKDQEYYRGFDLKTRYKRKVWYYKIEGNDGNTYYKRGEKVFGLVRNKILCVSSMDRSNERECDIREIMSPQKFRNVVKKRIALEEESIEFTKNEVKRLYNLIDREERGLPIAL